MWRAQRTAGLLLASGACAGLLMPAGCAGGRGRQRVDDVNVGLANLVQEEGGGAAATLEEPAQQPASEEELASLLEQQARALEQAFGGSEATGREPEDAATASGVSEADPAEPLMTEADGDDGAVSASLADMMASEGATSGPEAAGSGGETDPATEPDTEAAEDMAVSPEVEVDALYVQLQQALGEEIQSTSEPFRSAVAIIALAAARGEDPLAAIGPETAAGARLSPAERRSAETIAQLLGTLLSPDSADEGRRAEVLGRLAGRLTQDIGLRIPTAALCTRVRGFGKYEPFSKTDFLAGRPIRALVYAEVDGFEHREMDFADFGSVEVQDKWSVELSEELHLYHVADGRLAWRRPAEKVIETSRNRQRDFYLLAEIELPRTLTIGSYELKVVIKDDVSGAVAEKIIPIGVVADPGLAWTPEQ